VLLWLWLVSQVSGVCVCCDRGASVCEKKWMKWPVTKLHLAVRRQHLFLVLPAFF